MKAYTCTIITCSEWWFFWFVCVPFVIFTQLYMSILILKGKIKKRCFYWKSNASYVIVLVVVNVTVSIRSIGHGFFFSMTLGKKYTGLLPWCNMILTCIFIGYKINISVFFLHKRERVISLGSKNEMCFINLHHCQIRGSPRPWLLHLTFTQGVHNKKV